MAAQLRSDLWQRLTQIAAQQQRDPNALVEEWLREVEAATPPEGGENPLPPPNTLARLAYSAQLANLHSGTRDTVERSREILQDEYGDYLLKRMNRPADE